MIILDTNVISETLRPKPSQDVATWLSAQSETSLFLTAITVGELLVGVSVLPVGKRRSRLHSAIIGVIDQDFADRVLPFDHAAAEAYAMIAADRRQRGQPISQSDAQIAGIVRSRGARLATRNARDFRDCGFDVVDPWSTPPQSAPASPPR